MNNMLPKCTAPVLFSILIIIITSSQVWSETPDYHSLVKHITLSASQLADKAGKTISDDNQLFVLDADEQAALVISAPFPFRSLGTWWNGSLNNDYNNKTSDLTSGLYETIIAVDTTTQREYAVVESDDLSPENTDASGLAGCARVGSLIHIYKSPGNAVKLRFRGPLTLESLTLVFIKSPDSSIPVPDANLYVMNVEDDLQEPAAYPKPPVNSRASWNADNWWCSPYYCTTTHDGIHHTASASEYYSTSWSECAQNVKSTQAYHMYTRGWCDIGYNYLICVHGQIWEGRDGGDDIVAAHDGYNCGSMGVSYMGYFHYPYNQTLNTQMIDAVAELGAWKCDQQGIDPLGWAWYSGYGGSMRTVYGHRDVGATACPGDYAYAEQGTVRQEIQDRLDGSGGGPIDIIMDNPLAYSTQSWTLGSSSGDKYGLNYLWRSTGITPGLVYWKPNIPEAGYYSVYFWWPAGSNRNPVTKLGVRINGITYQSTVNQQINGGKWNLLGSYWLPVGNKKTLVGISSNGSSGYVVVADAIRLVK